MSGDPDVRHEDEENKDGELSLERQDEQRDQDRDGDGDRDHSDHSDHSDKTDDTGDTSDNQEVNDIDKIDAEHHDDKHSPSIPDITINNDDNHTPTHSHNSNSIHSHNSNSIHSRTDSSEQFETSPSSPNYQGLQSPAKTRPITGEFSFPDNVSDKFYDSTNQIQRDSADKSTNDNVEHEIIDLTNGDKVENNTQSEEDDDDDDMFDDEEAEIIDVITSHPLEVKTFSNDLKSTPRVRSPGTSPERDSSRTSPQKSESSFTFDDINTSPTSTTKGAAGTIDYASYSKGPEDRLVSRLVSNFESQMDSTETKVERRAFGRAKLRTLVSPVALTFPDSVKKRDTEKSFEENDRIEEGQPLQSINEISHREPTDEPPAAQIEEHQEPDDTQPTVVPDIIISKSPSPPKPTRIPTFQLKPIETVKEEVEESQNIIFGVCVVGFHHSRGPEVEYWIGPDGDKSTVWPYLAFQSLPDGSHARDENFCYFTLLYDDEKKIAVNPTPKRDKEGHIIEESDFKHVTTLFGISCNRQVKTEELKHVTDDMTRSTVQKSVVVVARKPIFGPIKEKLAVVTRAYFIQGDFEDRQLIDNLYENLTQIFTYKLDDASMNIGMPLRELIYRLGSKVLVILKALFLEKKVLFFASNTELLCASQFSIVSLVPSLINHLEDCGSPLLSSYETALKKPTSLRTSDRSSLLAFMGLPLQLFAAGGIFSPYVPLQQLAELQADETKYFLVGSTNSLVLAPRADMADVVVNVSVVWWMPPAAGLCPDPLFLAALGIFVSDG